MLFYFDLPFMLARSSASVDGLQSSGIVIAPAMEPMIAHLSRRPPARITQGRLQAQSAKVRGRGSFASNYAMAHSADNNAACSTTVSVALACLSGGYPCCVGGGVVFSVL
ncbi:MAG TPA: hypothetical protein VF405_05725 [Gammaproteobacteria bacterium]